MSLFKHLASRVPSVAVRQMGRSHFSNNSIRRSAHERFIQAQPSYGPIGVARALQGLPTSETEPTLFTHEFSLTDRVGLVTGGNRGIGLETALTLLEAGARVVYCVDIPKEPSEELLKVRDYVSRMRGAGRLEYICGDVRDQEAVWKVGETIGDHEGRLDVCVAAAGSYTGSTPSMEFPGQELQDVVDVNLKGVLFTAQAAGRQMLRFDKGGSIILIASTCGTVAMEPMLCNVSYHSTKSAILQMSRSIACELGSKRVRVNTISPGFIATRMTNAVMEEPELYEQCASRNPLGRFGRTDELRGAVAWLASDASSFCTGSDFIVSGGQQAW